MRNERHCIGDGTPLLLTPSEVQELIMQTDLPGGIYDLMDGIAKIYGVNTQGDKSCRILFSLAAAFVAGYAYAKGGV